MSFTERFLLNLINYIKYILQTYRRKQLNRQIANNQDLETLGKVKRFKGV